MNQEEIRKKLKSREALDFIHNRVFQMMQEEKELAATGLICGQAVASAAIEFMGMENEITPVYNDVDMFVPISGHRNIENNEINKKMKRDFDLIKTIKSNNIIEGEQNRYSFNVLGLRSNYRIEESIRAGNLNKTFVNIFSEQRVKMSSLYKNYLNLILSDFDINSTKIGYMKEKDKISELTVSNSFIEFLYTKQLKVDNWNTPYHSLVRFADKKKELGVYGDFREMAELGMGFGEIVKKAYEAKGLTRNGTWEAGLAISRFSDTVALVPEKFGLKYKEKYNKHKDLFEAEGIGLEEKGEGIFSLKDDSGKALQRLEDAFFNNGGDIVFGEGVDDEALQEMKRTIRGKDILFEAARGDEPDNKYDSENTRVYKGLSHDERRKEPYGSTELRLKSETKTLCLATVLKLPKIVNNLKYSKNSTKNAIRKNAAQLIDGTRRNIIKEPKENLREVMNSSTRVKSFFSLLEEATSLVPSDIQEINTLERQIFGKDINRVNHENLLETFRGEVPDTKTLAAALRNLKEEIKEEESLIGEIESNKKIYFELGGIRGLADSSSIKKIQEEISKDLNKELVKDGDIKDIYNEIEFDTDGFDIKALNTKKQLNDEGSKLKHCVGGYSNAVQETRSIIFSCTPKRKAEDDPAGENIRFTMEVGRRQIGKIKVKGEEVPKMGWEIIQARGLQNREVPMTEDVVDMLKKISAHLPIQEISGSVGFASKEEDIYESRKEEVNKEITKNRNILDPFVPSLMNEDAKSAYHIPEIRIPLHD